MQFKLNEKYNRENFLTFVKEFLPDDFTFGDKDHFNLNNKSRYKEIVSTKELGYSKILGLSVLEMEHKRNNDPRITIATDAFKILADHHIHKALVIFKNEDTENYRFSYLTINIDINDDNKIVRNYSNARRYSFYLGPDAKIRTPEQQLIKKGKVKDLEDLFSRFSVEVVNKEFYLEVAKHFDELVEVKDKNFSLPDDSNSDLNLRKSFAVRLIGRIMFCWFLKQKVSLSGQLVPDELLSSKVVTDNYYHNILEPLFFGVLNTNINDRDIRSDLFDKVPYLNGGLFNPQTEDYYDFDKLTFSSRYINTLKIKDDWFKKFFELLETYNFTIDENTVFDQELSVDPEMLGRIFENLLAEINPETGSSEKKRTGSFYTPRPIVEYMVDQSLIEYLKTKTKIEEEKIKALISYDISDDFKYPLSDEEKLEVVKAIDTLRALDPACGSGAFPIGLLQKIVYILQIVDPKCTLWVEQKLKDVPDLYKQKLQNDFAKNPPDYIRKLEVIKNSIFGVDIQPIAVDISRLRCFLTLVVESEIDDNKPNRGIDPLPNLDFKFVCANTLINAPESESDDEGNKLFHDDFQERLSSAVDRYFSSNWENKRTANNEIHKLIDGKVEEKMKHLSNFVSINGDKKIEELRAVKNKKNIEEHSRILMLWNSYKNIFENKPVDFFDPKYFFPSIKNGFDIVIGNPPYVGEKGHKEIFQPIAKSRLGERFYQGKMDLFYFFFHVALDNLKHDGVMAFITTNYFITSTGGKNLRKDIRIRSSILKLLNFGELKIFESALGQHNMITLLQKVDNQEQSIDDLDKKAKTFITNRKGYLGESVLMDIINGIDKETNYYELNQSQLFSGENIKLTSGGLDDILDKIKANSNTLLEVSDINNGVFSGADFVNEKKINKYKLENTLDGDGIFYLTNKEVQSLRLNKEEYEYIKPLFKNSNIYKYVTETKNEMNLINMRYTDRPDLKYLPNLKNHFIKYKNLLINRPKTGTLESAIGNDFWYVMSTSRKVDMEREKIVCPQRSNTNTFGYNNIPWYAASDVFFITKPKYDYTLRTLLGVLNSKLVYIWLYNRGKRKGENLELTVEPLSNIPIPKLTKENKPTTDKIEKLVDEILKKKNKNPEADTKDLEKEIDQLVYELYGLTEEEVRVVEGGK